MYHILQDRRCKAVQELIRILKPGGQALIYVWAMEQELNKVRSKYLREKKLEKTDIERSSPCYKNKLDDSASNIEIEEEAVKNSKENSKNRSAENSLDSNRSDVNRHRKSGEFMHADESSECCSSSDINTDVPELRLAVHKNRTEFKQQDLLVPWELKNQKDKEKCEEEKNVFHRFYHVFHKGELEALCDKVGSCKVVDSYYDQGNWAVILQKLS